MKKIEIKRLEDIRELDLLVPFEDIVEVRVGPGIHNRFIGL